MGTSKVMFFKLGLHKWALFFCRNFNKAPNIWVNRKRPTQSWLCWTEMPMPWKKAPEKWKERRTPLKQFRTQIKTHKLPCETPNGMDLSCHRSKTHIQRCCRDGGTFALWKNGESWKMKDAPFESWMKSFFLFFGKSKQNNPKTGLQLKYDSGQSIINPYII